MTTTDTEAPELVYRGLDHCDLRREALASGEQLAGICPACRWPDPPRKPPMSTGTKHAHQSL